jgi:tetratricopeptide (TPR) repeat protein
MIFIIATTIFFALSFFIIYKLANFIGLKISIKSLFLCAICSLLINLILPLNIKLFNHSNLSIVFIIALLSSYFITYYNEKITSSQIDPDEEAFLNTEVLNELLPLKFKTLFSTKKLLTETSSNKDNEPIIIENLSINNNTTLITEEPVIEAEVSNEVVEEPIIETEASNEIIEKPVIKTDDIADINENYVLLSDNDVFTTDDMDELVDLATEYKDSSPDKAFKALQKALFNNQENDYAPFIIIEMTNILKAQGLYAEAIEIYQQALMLNIIKTDSYLLKQFSNTITYLSILKTTLTSYNLPKLPFKEISPEILAIVEKDFAEKNQNL